MSVFSKVPTYDWLDDNEFAFAIRDPRPNLGGRVLIVSKRVVPTWFDATHEERLAMVDLVDRVKRLLDGGEPPPQGYSVGFDAGEAAGQTVMHLHVHMVPRRAVEAPPLPAQSAAVAPRPLPPSALERARQLVDAFLARPGLGVLEQHGGRRARVLGPALEGGVRIVGPDTGFVEHTISELDIAGVIAAEDENALHLLEASGAERRGFGGASSADAAWAIALLRASRSGSRVQERVDAWAR